MNELIDRLAAKARIDEAVAEKTGGAIRGFLRKEGPAGQVQVLFGKIPRAETLRSETLGLFRFA